MPITSDPNTPIRTGADSPDTLPARGYTVDQLANYIERQLGSPVWNLEITRQQILDSIQDAVALFSTWVPLRRGQTVQLVRSRFNYIDGVDVGQGVANVEFVDPVPAPTEIFYGNLLNPAPLFRTGLDEYDIFLRWRKTWKRVTSIEPQWEYDEYVRRLMIYNPIERYMAGVTCFFNYPNTQSLPGLGALWVKEYATARARFLQGDIWMKFSGAIPAPMKDIQLDQQRRDTAAQDMKDLKEQLKGMQSGAGVWDRLDKRDLVVYTTRMKAKNLIERQVEESKHAKHAKQKHRARLELLMTEMQNTNDPVKIERLKTAFVNEFYNG